MTQIDESTSLSIQVRVRKEAVKHPAKTHAHKVKRELAASDSSSTTGLIYLPGQVSEQYEDTDGYYSSAAFFFSCFHMHAAITQHHDLGTTIHSSNEVARCVWMPCV